MTLRLKYWVPNENAVVDAGETHLDMSWWDEFVVSMVQKNTDVIFFYTVDTTDIDDKTKPQLEEQVFVYDEKHGVVSSITKFHEEECSIVPLVEAHPNVIYFYATLIPS